MKIFGLGQPFFSGAGAGWKVLPCSGQSFWTIHNSWGHESARKCAVKEFRSTGPFQRVERVERRGSVLVSGPRPPGLPSHAFISANTPLQFGVWNCALQAFVATNTIVHLEKSMSYLNDYNSQLSCIVVRIYNIWSSKAQLMDGKFQAILVRQWHR